MDLPRSNPHQQTAFFEPRNDVRDLALGRDIKLAANLAIAWRKAALLDRHPDECEHLYGAVAERAAGDARLMLETDLPGHTLRSPSRLEDARARSGLAPRPLGAVEDLGLDERESPVERHSANQDRNYVSNGHLASPSG